MSLCVQPWPSELSLARKAKTYNRPVISLAVWRTPVWCLLHAIGSHWHDFLLKAFIQCKSLLEGLEQSFFPIKCHQPAYNFIYQRECILFSQSAVALLFASESQHNTLSLPAQEFLSSLLDAGSFPRTERWQ